MLITHTHTVSEVIMISISTKNNPFYLQPQLSLAGTLTFPMTQCETLLRNTGNSSPTEPQENQIVNPYNWETASSMERIFQI